MDADAADLDGAGSVFSQESSKTAVAAPEAGPGHRGKAVAPDDTGLGDDDGPMPPSLRGAGSSSFSSSSLSSAPMGRSARVRRSCYACGTTATGLWYDAAGKSYSAVKAPADPNARLFCDALPCREAGRAGLPRLCLAGNG
jgi:hypothetical protein